MSEWDQHKKCDMPWKFHRQVVDMTTGEVTIDCPRLTVDRLAALYGPFPLVVDDDRAPKT